MNRDFSDVLVHQNTGPDYVLADGATGFWIECFGTTLHIFQPFGRDDIVRIEQSKNDDCDDIISSCDFRL